MLTINGIDGLKAHADEDVGVSGWHEVTQAEVDAFADQEGPRLQTAEQVELFLTGVEQPRTGPLELVVGVPGMHHELEFLKVLIGEAREAVRGVVRAHVGIGVAAKDRGLDRRLAVHGSALSRHRRSLGRPAAPSLRRLSQIGPAPGESTIVRHCEL